MSKQAQLGRHSYIYKTSYFMLIFDMENSTAHKVSECTVSELS